MTGTSAGGRAPAAAVLAALVIMVVPVVPVDAFHADDLPLLASGDGTGSGWFSFTVETDGAPFAADIQLGGAHGAFQGGLLEYHADERFRAGFRGTWLPAENEVLVHREGTDDAALLLRDGDGGAPGLGGTWNAAGPVLVGTYKVLFYAVAEEADDHTWTIRGEPGVTVHGVEVGEDAAMYTSRDLTADRNIKASFSVPFAGAGARHTEEGRLTLDVDEVLLGSFGSARGTGMHQDELSAERDGFTRPCPCHMNEIKGINAWRTGTYTFETSGTSVGVAPEVYLAVVHDPVLPA